MSKVPESDAKRSPGGAPESRQERIVLALWEQTREQLLEDMKILEQIPAALAGGTFNDGLRQKAAVEAHKLIGSFGILKLREGARLASALEDLLNGPEIQKADPAALKDTVSTMRRLLIEGPLKQGR